jgi:hypothetical protein
MIYFNIININEGYINRLDIGDGEVPYVPHDSVCMILYSMGVKIDRMQYLKNKCQGPTNNKNKDESNICRA